MNHSLPLNPLGDWQNVFAKFLPMPALFLLLAFSCSLYTHAQTVATGKSFVNISRPNGGTFLPGDIIEVRATIAVSGGSTTNRINSIRYNDTINTAKFEYIPNTLRLLTNEGKLYRQYTDATNDDPGVITTNQFIRFNVGESAGNARPTDGNGTTRSGSLHGAVRPTFYGTTSIQVYSYQIRIRNTPVVVIDELITLNAGNFRYRIGSSSTDQSSNFRPYRIRIAPDYGLCASSFGTNAILGESGGTFGSGTITNKSGGSPFVPLPYNRVDFATNAPQDNDYAVANNTAAVPVTNTKVHTVWDIIGDHTGSADPLQGNAPAAPGTEGGHTLVINASYQTNIAFTQNITNLCEETFYEFSAWFRNICPKCGCDADGRGSSSNGYVPTGPSDSSGVKPNLSFQIDGEEYYTSGNIEYTGQWIKKGFVFRTKPGQTSFTVTIRNNAPGGGGNDWAIDDIAVATCLPNMSYSPSLTPNICENNSITIYDTVRSYFDNYRYYQWQYQASGSSSWSNIGASVGPVTPVHNGDTWEYVAQNEVAPSHTTPANAGDRYRLVVATSANNLLNETCRSTDVMNAVTLNVINCAPILSTSLLSFNALQQGNHTQLSWSTSKENEELYFDVERSFNGSNYEKISTVNSAARYTQANNHYNYTDNQGGNNKRFYRIKMYNKEGKITYSKIISLGQTEASFTVNSVINPFNQEIKLDITATQKEALTIELNDYSGKKIKQQSFDIKVGANTLKWNGMDDLPYGMYIIRVTGKTGKSTTHKLIKSAKR